MTGNSGQELVLEQIRAAMQSWRRLDSDSREGFAGARDLANLVEDAAGAPSSGRRRDKMIVNDRLDVALSTTGGRGVHLGRRIL